MRAFAPKQKVPQQATSAKSTVLRRANIPQANSIIHLQRTIGNQAVQRLSEANSMVGRHPFSATVRLVGKQHGTPSAAARVAAHDSMPGEEIEPVPTSLEPSVIGAILEEPAEGETVALPDVILPGVEGVEMSDTVASSLTYSGSYSLGTATPRGFGVTKVISNRLIGVKVTRDAKNKVYKVGGTLERKLTYQARADKGPKSQVNIESDSDADIKQSNYKTVSSDLTPNVKDLKGRPPRTKFWARDLTLKHEKFHAVDDVKYGKQGTTLAQTWLNSQKAASVGDVARLTAQVPGKVAATVAAGMAYPGREERAYADGFTAYATRATSIKTKGDATKYPT